LDAGTKSGKGSLRNGKSATYGRRNDGFDGKAITGFDSRNEEKKFKSKQNQKKMQASTHLCFQGSNNQNKGPPQRV